MNSLLKLMLLKEAKLNAMGRPGCSAWAAAPGSVGGWEQSASRPDSVSSSAEMAETNMTL